MIEDKNILLSKTVDAAMVLYGEFFDASKAILPVQETPEQCLLNKETFKVVSDEVKEFISLIEDVPERIYKDNGVLNQRELFRYARRRKGWGKKKFEALKFELWFFLRAVALR
jgi:hypothetical protein